MIIYFVYFTLVVCAASENKNEYGLYLGGYDRRRDVGQEAVNQFRPSSSSCFSGLTQLVDGFSLLSKSSSPTEMIESIEKFQELLTDTSVDAFWSHYGLMLSLLKFKSGKFLNRFEGEVEPFCNRLDKEMDSKDKKLAGLVACRHFANTLYKIGFQQERSEVIQKAVWILERLIKLFKDSHHVIKLYKDYGTILRKTNNVELAKQIFQALLKHNPNDGFASASLGWIFVVNDLDFAKGADLLLAGVQSNQSGTQESVFYYQLDYALNRINRQELAQKVHVEAVEKGIFLSKFQRPIHLMTGLRAQPIWNIDELDQPTSKSLKVLELNWITIRDEALSVVNKHGTAFVTEVGRLFDQGIWKQMKLFSRGIKVTSNCVLVPKTCRLIEENMLEATLNRKGEVKFSLLAPNTHVSIHCGPTNFRLRAHLGLVIPPPGNLTAIRLADRPPIGWSHGKFTIIDDSFEHEVWHNGTSSKEVPRIILLIDMLHPDLSDRQKRYLQRTNF